MNRHAGPFAVALGLAIGACAHTPTSATRRAELNQSAQATVQRMSAEAPDLRGLLAQSAGYIVFPQITSGGLGIGAAGGAGIAYQNGRPVGYAELRQMAVGALAGGQSYSQILVVRDPQTFERIKRGRFDMGAHASAVVLRRGAATEARFDDSGLAVLIDPRGGAMVNASLSGQRIRVRQ